MGNRLRIVAPSGVIDPFLVNTAAAFLSERGYEVSISKHACGSYGRFSGTPEDRLADLNEALADATLDYVLCARGGYGLVQIIDKVVVADSHCPTVIGFSDITALHNLLGRRGKASIHGVMCKHIAEYTGHREAVNRLLEAMQSGKAEYSLPAHSLNCYGTAKGTLRGGNLSVLYGLQGTPYATPINDGDILFIEDIGEHPYAIDRMMNSLRLSGVLARLGGLIVGQFSDCDEDSKMPYTIYESIQRMTQQYHYPVLFGFPAGHVADNFPLVLNSGYELTVTGEGVSLQAITD